MRIVEIRYAAPGEDSYPEGVTCSGTTVSESSKRVMACTRPATTWRTYILDDGTQVPKPLCDVHKEPDRLKWEAVMAGTYKEPRTPAAEARAAKLAAEKAAAALEREALERLNAKRSDKAAKVAKTMVAAGKAVPAAKSTRRSKVVPEGPVGKPCASCYRPVAVPNPDCEDHS
jgi:hypothetical protein